MVGALRGLGVPVEVDGERVAIGAHDGLRGGGTVDCGLAGTVMRFVPPVAALADGAVAFDGDPHARDRPMAPVLDALRALGVASSTADAAAAVHRARHRRGARRRRGHRRVGVAPVRLRPAARRRPLRRGRRRAHDGKPVPSLPHIEMTVAMLREPASTSTTPSPTRWRVAPGPIRARDGRVEPDLSNAAPFLPPPRSPAGGSRSRAGPRRRPRPATRCATLLAAMGARRRARATTG